MNICMKEFIIFVELRQLFPNMAFVYAWILKEFIIFVCTDSTEIFLSKLRSFCSNYNLQSFFTDSVRGVSNKHCLLTFFICFARAASYATEFNTRNK